jgi:spore coat polysaccharide biosynthesis protein SpsF
MVAAGKPLLAHLIERLQRARTLDRVIVATTTNREDDEIERLCAEVGAGCFRGSSEDVLGRVAAALDRFSVDVHVEIHGDGPLADWRLIDRAVATYLEGSADLVTNAQRITYPPGLELWVYGASLCARLARERREPKYRDSPILYVMQHPAEFTIRNFEAPPELHAPEMYIEVDEAVDFELVKTIIERLYPRNPAFLPEDVLALLAREPELADRNRSVARRWKEAIPAP